MCRVAWGADSFKTIVYEGSSSHAHGSHGDNSHKSLGNYPPCEPWGTPQLPGFHRKFLRILLVGVENCSHQDGGCSVRNAKRGPKTT